MRLSLHIIGVTTAFLLGAHIHATPDLITQSEYLATSQTTEQVDLGTLGANPSTETIDVKPSNHTAILLVLIDFLIMR